MMKKFINACVGILPKPLQNIYYKYEDKWLYLFFGVLTTVVSFLTAGITKFILEKNGAGETLVSNVSTLVSWVCAVTFAYLTNRVWVFDSHASGAKEIIVETASFYGGRVFTLLVEMIMMWIGYSLIAPRLFAGNDSAMNISYWVSKIAANIVVLILNYVISKIFVFKKKDTKND
ncbi:MAG: GtrA family protein [Ruminococcus sp.]|nr:GtrA family protein [Ruminococcus sp.]